MRSFSTHDVVPSVLGVVRVGKMNRSLAKFHPLLIKKVKRRVDWDRLTRVYLRRYFQYFTLASIFVK